MMISDAPQRLELVAVVADVKRRTLRVLPINDQNLSPAAIFQTWSECDER